MGSWLAFFFMLFLLMGVPIAVALGLTCICSVAITGAIPVEVLIQKTFNSSNGSALMAIPFFVLAGNIMASGGVSKRLVGFANAMLGHVTGGLALVATVASTFFGAVSGLSLIHI